MHINYIINVGWTGDFNSDETVKCVIGEEHLKLSMLIYEQVIYTTSK